VKINDKLMTSTDTRHVARWLPDDAANGQGAWVVSWLPLQLLTQDQAVTAMVIAEKVAQGIAPGDRVWPHVENWAYELGLTGPDAVARAMQPAAEDAG
jgi:hypothetical protein